MYDLVNKSQTNHLTKIKACHLGIPTHSATAPQKPGRIHMRMCSNQVNDLASTSVEDRRITHACSSRVVAAAYSSIRSEKTLPHKGWQDTK